MQQSFVINLPERKDRLNLFKQELEYTFFSPQLILGVKHNDPMIGIGQAHINCITLAKQRELHCILIMEDDLVFNGKEKTTPYLKMCMENLPEDWDILLGGIYSGKPKKYNEYWSLVKEFCGLQFYIVNSKAYDKILQYDFKTHIDRWLGKQDLKCYVANKFFATQRSGLSNNTGKNEDYSNRLKKYDLL